MGPVFLGIAQDRMEAPGPVPLAADRPAVARGRVRPDPDTVRAAAAVLADARRPLVVAGAEAFRAPAGVDAVAALVRAPILVEDRRTIECAEPAAFGGFAGALDSRSAAVRECDAVLLAGARAPIRFEHTAPPVLPPGVPVVQLSEDPRELALGPAEALAVLGDVELGLRDLASALGELAPAADGAFRDDTTAAHRARLQELRAAADADADAVPIRVSALMRRLCGALAPGTWIVDDSVTSQAALLDHALAHDSQLRYLTTAGGSLGWAMGGALGVAEARPGEPVVAVVGDGVFQFGLPALWTAVDRALRVTFVVVNNRAYAAVRAALRRFDGDAVARGHYPATDLSGPDIAAVARGFGAASTQVRRLDELDAAIAQAREAPGPAVIEVLTDSNDSGPVR